MKKIFFALSIAIAALVSCTPETPNEEPEVPKSNECKLNYFKVSGGDVVIEGFVDQGKKTVELSCMPSEAEELVAATAEVKISAGASISPDPTQPMDYNQELKFTVTAEDGETAAEYTVYIAPAEFNLGVNFVRTFTYGKFNATHPTAASQAGFAFSGMDIVFDDFVVGTLDGTVAGTLNIEGIPEGHPILTMSNDQLGVLAAVVGDDVYDKATNGAVYAWLDGWQNAPTCVIPELGYRGSYFSVSGDIKNGDALWSINPGLSGDGYRTFMIYQTKGGDLSKVDTISELLTVPHLGNDGCWGTQLSFPTANPDDGFVAWDSIGGALNQELTGGSSTNATSAFFSYPSLSEVNEDSETILWGLVSWGRYDREPGYYGYGNWSHGSVRAFRFEGQNYALQTSASWDAVWITIQRMDNVLEDDIDTEEDETEMNYILETTFVTNCSGQTYNGCAYVYDPATGKGHILAGGFGAVIDYYVLESERL